MGAANGEEKENKSGKDVQPETTPSLEEPKGDAKEVALAEPNTELQAEPVAEEGMAPVLEAPKEDAKIATADEPSPDGTPAPEVPKEDAKVASAPTQEAPEEVAEVESKPCDVFGMWCKR